MMDIRLKTKIVRFETCKLCGQAKHLRDINEEQPEWWRSFTSNRTPIHMILSEPREIPLAKIVGSVFRAHDFYPNWTPHKNARDHAYVALRESMERKGYDPTGDGETKYGAILLYAIANEYWVDNGNRRVSVAKSLRIKKMIARVWVHQGKSALSQ